MVSVFAGSITNSGTISAGNQGIFLDDVATFTGSITNSGAISSKTEQGIYIISGTIFTGNIVNSGTITSKSHSGILIAGVSTFTGSISNSGTISGRTGIEVEGGTIFTGNIVNSGTISGSRDGIVVDDILTFSGGITNSGKITAKTSGIGINGGASVGGGITNSGAISAKTNGIAIDGGATFAGGITNSGAISAKTNGIAIDGGATFAGGITNSGTISAKTNGIAIDGGATFAGGITNSGTISAATTGIVIDGGAKFAGGITNSGTITGAVAAINVSGATSAVTIDQTGGLISGAILLSANADVLNISGGTISGNVVGSGSSDTVNFALGGGGTFTYASPYAMTGLNLVNFNSGTVWVDGSIQATTIDINNGGIAAGTGTLAGAVTVGSGGTLMPGQPLGTLSITGGPLTFDAGSYYLVHITPSANAETSVTGNVAINGGTVQVTPQFGHYAAIDYTIISATGTRSGTFSGLTFTAPYGYTGGATLAYGTNYVDLDLGAGYALMVTPPGANRNQQSVVAGFDSGILAGDAIPAAFQNLGNLTGAALLNTLTKLDGEDATGSQKGSFQLMTEFLDLMLDPWTGGGGVISGGGATGFAAENDAGLPPDVALAYARALKKQTPAQQQPQDFEQRWSAWGSGFGGTSTTEGNTVIGSNTVTASTYGYAAGMDYHATPNTVYGFALAGGGTNWSLAQNLGSGRSDAFQMGVHGTTQFGPAYVSGALAFANHWFTTNRVAALGDQLQANFEGQSYAARVEAGYRYAVLPLVGVTPYAALQAQDFHTPGYSETDLNGGGFGLSYNAMNATDTRSELGARFDDLTMLNGMPLVLRARLAWAHDWISDPSLGAVFQALPGSNFTVNGATPPANSALTTAAAELHLTANWTAMAKFDGEFAGSSQTYAGTGTLKYSW